MRTGIKRIFLLAALFLAGAAGAVAQEPEGVAESRVVIDGGYFYVHTVRPGETLYSLGRRYGVEEEEIVRSNPGTAEGLRAGEAIKIPAPAPEPLPRNLRNRTTGNRQMEVHTVNSGETAYSIARRYGISVDDLIDFNPGLDPARLSIGQHIRILREAMGTSSPSEIDADFARYAEAVKELEEGSLPDTPVLPSEPDSLPVPGGKYEEGNEWNGNEWNRRRPLDPARPLQVALLLPFTVDGREETSMADFYRGTLLGLQELKAAGISVDLSVYDTKDSAYEVREILWELEDADLIVGPRDGAAFDEAARFAGRRRIPIVSPQSVVEGGNPFVFQARPAPEYQYEKLRPYLTEEHNVVLIVPAEGVDRDFLTEIERLLPAGVRRVPYSKNTAATAIRNVLSRDRENIVIVPTSSENVTDDILPAISSIQNNVTATTGRGYDLRVMGSPQWARFRNNDRELFFKLQAMYPTLYYADRTNPAVGAFSQRYLEAFGVLPSLFSYRGYDVAKLFITALHDYGDDYDRSINRVNTPLLQVPYHFRQDYTGKWVNDQWVLVRYRNNYIIEVR